MSLDATEVHITKIGTVTIAGGEIEVKDFEGKNCSGRDAAVLACLFAIETLVQEVRKTIEKPGGGRIADTTGLPGFSSDAGE